MAAFFKRKKFIIGAVAVLLAAIAAIVAVTFTYAAYRNEITGDGGAEVAGAVADYARGDVTRNGVKIDTVNTDSQITISELQPGDTVRYNFSVNGYKTDGDVTSFNEVLLKITCTFSFEYSYPVTVTGEDGTATETIKTEYLNALADNGTVSVRFYRGDTQIAVVSGDTANGGQDPTYANPKDETTTWQVSQYKSGEGVITQKLGFYLHPVGATADEWASQNLSFEVMVPSQSSTVDDNEEIFRLSVDLNITAEQELVTDNSGIVSGT